MMRQPGASSGSGHGGAGLLHSGSREALANQENKQQPTKKVNAYILTRKLNSKIQAIASKLTEIFVWMQKIGECQEKSMPLSLMYVVILILDLLISWSIRFVQL